MKFIKREPKHWNKIGRLWRARQAEVPTDKKTDRQPSQTGIHTDRQPDRQTSSQAGRQTHSGTRAMTVVSLHLKAVMCQLLVTLPYVNVHSGQVSKLHLALETLHFTCTTTPMIVAITMTIMHTQRGGEEGGNLAQMALQAQQRTKQQIPESLRLVFQKCCQPSETQRVTIDQTRNKACIINGQGENYTSCTSWRGRASHRFGFLDSKKMTSAILCNVRQNLPKVHCFHVHSPSLRLLPKASR